MQSLFRRYLDYLYHDMVNKRLAAQIRHVQVQNVEVYLDLGCHVGYNTDRVRQAVNPKVCLGLEYDPTSVQLARDRGIQAVRHDLNQPLPLRAESVDVVTIYDVLEHLVETWRLLTEVYRIVRPGGLVLIDCPNLAAWHNVLALVLGIQPPSGPHLLSIADSDLQFVEDMHKRDHHLTGQRLDSDNIAKMHRHIVIPTFRSLCRVMIKAGFQIEASWGFGYYPFPPPVADWLCKIDTGHSHHYLVRARKPVAPASLS